MAKRIYHSMFSGSYDCKPSCKACSPAGQENNQKVKQQEEEEEIRMNEIVVPEMLKVLAKSKQFTRKELQWLKWEVQK